MVFEFGIHISAKLYQSSFGSVSASEVSVHCLVGTSDIKSIEFGTEI